MKKSRLIFKKAIEIWSLDIFDIDDNTVTNVKFEVNLLTISDKSDLRNLILFQISKIFQFIKVNSTKNINQWEFS